METLKSERLLFAALFVVGLLGVATKAFVTTCDVDVGIGDLAIICSNALLFFGGVGATGLLCLMVFGPASIGRAHFWAFIAGILGAVVLFLTQ